MASAFAFNVQVSLAACVISRLLATAMMATAASAMATTAITATMAMVLRCFALFFCAVGCIGVPLFSVAFVLSKTLRVYKNISEKRFTTGNNVDYFAMKGICLWMGVLGASGVRGIYAGRRNVLRGFGWRIVRH